MTVSSSILLTALNDACPNRDPWLNVIIGPDDQPPPSLCCKGQSLKRGDFDVHLILIEGGGGVGGAWWHHQCIGMAADGIDNLVDTTGMLEPGGWGALIPQILADQLNLSQPWG